MRCPGCGSDTTPALPRCTRCNAPLHPAGQDDATVSDATVSDPTVAAPSRTGGTARSDESTWADTLYTPPPDPSASPPPSGWPSTPPSGSGPSGSSPPPASGEGETTISLSEEPWARADQQRTGGAQPPPSRDGETVISLSEEPWENDPWAEPEVWSPDKIRKQRSPLPYVLLGGGVVALIAVALAIIFWPSSSGTGTPTSNASAPPGNQSAGTQSEPVGDTPGEDDGTALNRQAGQVDSLLTEMSSTRSELGSVVTSGCEPSGLERIRTQRQEQLAKAKALDVSALENGTALRDALVRALEASVESNQRYLDVAPGCPSDDDVAPINNRASQAKREFIDLWRPNAEKAGLNVRSADDI